MSDQKQMIESDSRMRTAWMKRKLFLFLVGTVFCLAFTAKLNGQDSLPDGPWLMPKTWDTAATPEAQQVAFYDFIWRSFIALNWPNEELTIEGGEIIGGTRGKPDDQATLNDLQTRLAVWENYKEPGEVFPDPKVWNTPQYSNWNTVRVLSAESSSGQTIPSRRMLNFDSLTEYTSGTLQPYFFAMSTGPLYDQHGGLVRYEVAINRAFFTYIRHFGYYNAQKQADAVWNYIKDGSLRGTAQAFQRPPFGNQREIGTGGYLHDLPDYDQVGMIDVKAAWRVLDPNRDAEILDRYIVRKLHFSDGSPPQLMGLVALHVLRWTPNGYDPLMGVDGGFVASTFEQIDNVTSNATTSQGKQGEVTKIIPATFNDGGDPTPEELEYGFSGEIPREGSNHSRVNIYRATAQAIPTAVQVINQHYHTTSPVKGSVLQYYQLIGTQNRHPGPFDFGKAEGRESNGPQGPTTGVYSNANNLVNSALESYTQKNFTCIRCHIQARPRVYQSNHKGINTFPMRAFQDDHFKILTFLLQQAKFPNETD